MKRLSIIIVTYNSEHDIFNCVESIKKYCDIQRNELELIIVDNNSRSPQPMFAQLKSIWGDDIVLIENNKNSGSRMKIAPNSHVSVEWMLMGGWNHQ